MPERKSQGDAPARSWRPGGDDTPVIEPPTVVLTLEFDATEAAIAGRLIDQDQHAQAFTGWLGLTHALTAALAATRTTRPDPTSGELT